MMIVIIWYIFNKKLGQLKLDHTKIRVFYHNYLIILIQEENNMTEKPPYKINDEMVILISEISEKLENIRVLYSLNNHEFLVLLKNK